MGRTGRSLRWEPGWGSTNRGWRSRSPTGTMESSPGKIRRVRRGCWPSNLLGFDDPAQASQYARSDLARGGFGGCNYLIAGEEAAFVVQAPGACGSPLRS